MEQNNLFISLGFSLGFKLLFQLFLFGYTKFKLGIGLLGLPLLSFQASLQVRDLRFKLINGGLYKFRVTVRVIIMQH